MVTEGNGNGEWEKTHRLHLAIERQRSRSEASTVDDTVHPTKLGHRSVDRSLDLGLVPHVHLLEERAVLAELSHHLRTLLLIHVEKQDIRAVRMQELGGGQAKAAGAACDLGFR